MFTVRCERASVHPSPDCVERAAGYAPGVQTQASDERWIVVDGRRWRATDPSIPDALKAELVAELMDARRAVGAALRGKDEGAERAARARVQHAKVALGERGEPWWEPATEEGRDRRIDAALLAFATHRAPDGTTCPSDAARAIGGPAWRGLLPFVRERVRVLAHEGRVDVLQKGERLPPSAEWRGPVRVRLSASSP